MQRHIRICNPLLPLGTDGLRHPRRPPDRRSRGSTGRHRCSHSADAACRPWPPTDGRALPGSTCRAAAASEGAGVTPAELAERLVTPAQREPRAGTGCLLAAARSRDRRRRRRAERAKGGRRSARHPASARCAARAARAAAPATTCPSASPRLDLSTRRLDVCWVPTFGGQRRPTPRPSALRRGAPGLRDARAPRMQRLDALFFCAESSPVVSSRRRVCVVHTRVRYGYGRRLRAQRAA